MNIRSAIVLLVAVCLVASSLPAQSSRERPRAKAAMWPALHLSPAQQDRVRQIHARFAPAVKATQKQARDSAARINAHELAEVRNLLTSEQQRIFDSYMSGKRRARRGTGARLMPVRIDIPD
jgi:hypothetical protein